MTARYVIAIDFEAFGGVPSKHGFSEVGAIIMKLNDRSIMSEFRLYSNMKGYIVEPRCIEEFWAKPDNALRFKETIEAVTVAVCDPFQVIEIFTSWIDDELKKIAYLDGIVDPSDLDVMIITDNSPFDAGILKFFSKKDTLYLIGGKYRDIIDVSCVYIGMSMQPVTTKLLDSSSKKIALEGHNKVREWKGLPKLTMPTFDVKHTHHPTDDAHSMALYWAFFQDAIIECANAPMIHIIDWKVTPSTTTDRDE